MKPSTRERMVAAASSLFYRDGIGTTSIDAIVAEAGIAKPTLYRHFRSKDELITAVLELRDQSQRNRLSEMRDAAATPEAQLLVPFDQLVEWGLEPSYRGCALVTAALELSDPDHAGHKVLRGHKAWLHEFFRQIAHDLKAHQANRLAQRLMILLEGGTVQQGVRGSQRHGLEAREFASELIHAALAKGRT